MMLNKQEHEQKRREFFEGMRDMSLRQATLRGPGHKELKLRRIEHRKQEAQYYEEAIAAFEYIRDLEEENENLTEQIRMMTAGE